MTGYVLTVTRRIPSTQLHRADCREAGPIVTTFRRASKRAATTAARRLVPFVLIDCGCLDGLYPWTPGGHGPTLPNVTWDADGRPVVS